MQRQYGSLRPVVERILGGGFAASGALDIDADRDLIDRLIEAARNLDKLERARCDERYFGLAEKTVRRARLHQIEGRQRRDCADCERTRRLPIHCLRLSGSRSPRCPAPAPAGECAPAALRSCGLANRASRLWLLLLLRTTRPT